MTDPGNEDSITDILTRNRDDFDNPVALSTNNEGDLPGHYPISPERYRLFKNGNRQFFQYNSITELDDAVDGFKLTPQSAGDVMTLETAERFRYVVQYVVEWSCALSLNQTLQSGEIFAVGFGNPDLENTTDSKLGPSADGWFVYQNGDLKSDEVIIAEYRNGTEKDSVTVTTENLFQTYARIAGRTNWYNVGPTTVEETYTQNGEQLNSELGAVSVDDGKGPENANKAVTISLKAEGGAGNLTADVGSIGVRTLGNVDGIVRTRRAQIADQSIGTTGVYVPVAAIRIDPDETVVTGNLTGVTPTDYTGGGALKLVGFAVDSSKTDASGFATPPEFSDSNNVIEQTTNVSEMPDSTGTQTANPSNPGGYQLVFGSLQSDINKSGTTVDLGKVKKRIISNTDVVVFAAFVPSTGSTGDVTFGYGVELDY